MRHAQALVRHGMSMQKLDDKVNILIGDVNATNRKTQRDGMSSYSSPAQSQSFAEAMAVPTSAQALHTCPATHDHAEPALPPALHGSGA